MINKEKTRSWLGKIVTQNNAVYLVDIYHGINGKLQGNKISVSRKEITTSIEKEMNFWTTEELSEKEIQLI